MSDWLELFLRFLVILNPFSAAALWTSLSTPLETRERTRLGVVAGLAAFVALLVAALAGDWFLDLIDVSAPTWQMGAGLLLILGVLPVFLRRDPFVREPYGTQQSARWWATARMALNVATPATLAAMVYFGAAWDTADAVVALVLAAAIVVAGLALAWAIQARTGRWPPREAGRVVAAILVLLAVGMAVDGINSV